MQYKPGDQVVHVTHGPGKIICLEEKILGGRSILFYVVQINDLLVWVPAEASNQNSLRQITPACEFRDLFSILSSPAELLSKDRLERKNLLSGRMKAGSLVGICEVVRDLSYNQRAKKLNDNDAALLERAQNYLLSEWELALNVPRAHAEKQLGELLTKSFTQGQRAS